MKNGIREDYIGGTIFDVNRNAPQFAIACALQELDRQLGTYHRASTPQNQTNLLDEIERLRRFVLVRASLAKALARTKRHDNRTMGRQLCDVLHGMIGDVTSFVKLHTAPGAPTMERDSFRVIACLNFLGSLDAEFL
jgi:hypothetical protein